MNRLASTLLLTHSGTAKVPSLSARLVTVALMVSFLPGPTRPGLTFSSPTAHLSGLTSLAPVMAKVESCGVGAV
jgi:hypothetical protein